MEKNYLIYGRDGIGHWWYEGEEAWFDVLCDSCVWTNEQLAKAKLEELKNEADGNEYNLEEI